MKMMNNEEMEKQKSNQLDLEELLELTDETNVLQQVNRDFIKT